MILIDAVQIMGYKEYVTVDGDAYDLLAIAFYNDEKKASYIIQANERYTGTLIFDAGIRLRIPILDIMNIPDTLPPWRK